MQVTQYIFQSPSTSPVQVGRVDPSSVKNESQNSTLPSSVTNQSLQKAESFTQTQKSSVTPSVSSSSSLDLYV